MSEERIKAPGELLKERYIPLSKVQDACGISVDEVKQLINTRSIRYAEFMEPEAYVRSIHVDPVEIADYLERKRKRSKANGSK